MGIEDLVEYGDVKKFVLHLSSSLADINPVAQQYKNHGIKDIEMIRSLQKSYEIMRHVLERYPQNTQMRQDADNLLERAKKVLPREIYEVIYYNYKK